jgi:hypothetical protein
VTLLEHAVALICILVGAWTLIGLGVGVVIGKSITRADKHQSDETWLDVWDDPRDDVLELPYGEVLRICDEISDYNRLDTWA